MQPKRLSTISARALWLAAIATILVYICRYGLTEHRGVPSVVGDIFSRDTALVDGIGSAGLSRRDNPLSSSSSTSSSSSATSTDDESSVDDDSSIVSSEPTDPDDRLTWELALAKGENLVKLLDTEDNSGCGVKKSAFTDFKALDQFGWQQTVNQKGLAETANAPGLTNESTDALKAMSIPVDDDHNSQIQWDQSEEITVDGRTYNASQGEYYNVFNTAGHILAGVNYGPGYRGQFLSPPVTGDGIVPLSSWSDVVFLQWQEMCKGDQKCMQSLQTVVQMGVDNDATFRITDHALNGQNWTTYPGRTFSSGSEEFAAILATPNARGAAWLLLQRRQALGWKYIDSVQLFEGNTDFASRYLVLHIKDHQQNASPAQRRVLARTLDGADATPQAHAVDHPDDRGLIIPQKRGDDPIVYDTGGGVDLNEVYKYDHITKYIQAQVAGQYLVSLLNTPLSPSCVQPSKWTEFANLDANGWTLLDRRDAGLSSSIDFTRGMWQVVDDAKDPVDDDHNQEMYWVHSKQTKDNQGTYRPTKAYYDCIYGQHSIQAINIHSPQSQGKFQKPVIDGSQGKEFPPLRQFSDVVFLQWLAWCTEKKYDVKDLRMVVQRAISNDATKAIVKTIYNGKPVPGWPGDTFSADSPEFAALLSTPNAQGTVWMLAQHKDQFGVKTIKRIRVFCDKPQQQSNPYLVLYIDNLTPASSKRDIFIDVDSSTPRLWRSPAIGIRADADTIAPPSLNTDFNSDHSLDFAKYVSKGKDHLKNLLNGCGLPSKWTAYTDLAAQGWSTTTDSTNIRLFDGTPIADSLDYLQLSKAPHDQFEVADKHNVKTQHGEDTYFPTNANYNNKYNLGLITAQENEGPLYAGPNKRNNPPVTGDPHPFPDLRQWSDVVFLEYQRLMNKANQPLTSLKGVLRQEIKNDDTLKVIAHIVGGDAKSLSKSMKVWPGNDYGADSDELAALLGSPNGQGVAWLLRSHGDTLGLKTVGSVKIWWDTDAVNGGPMVLFSIVNADPDADPGVAQAPPSVIRNVRRRSKAAATTSKSLVKRALTKDAFDQLLTKGKPIRDALQAIDQCIQQTQWTEESALEAWGWYRQRKSPFPPYYFSVWQSVYKFLGASLEKDDNHWAVDAHSDKRVIKDVTYFPTAADYDNRYNENLIVAMVNFGPGEEGPQQRTPVNGNPNPFPELYHWSDIVALEFARFMKDTNKPTTNLKGVWQRQIINPDTQSLAAYLYGVNSVNDMGKAGEWPGKDYAPDSDEFAALLASPNGVGVAYLLLQHRELLGMKTITSIRVWRAEELHILFSIGDLASIQRRSIVAEWEPDNESEVPHGFLRQRDRYTNGLSDSALVVRVPSDNLPTVEQTKQSGAYFIDVQNTPTEQLESCKNIEQSAFTTIDQLGKSGWTEAVREPADVADTDIAVAQAWDSMKLDWKGDSITRVNLKHIEKTTGANGQIYLPTQAFYKDWYCIGAIVADENESPWKAGPALKDNPVDGTDKPFPPLRQWSDAVFLEYQDVCGGDSAKMKTLKGVLRKTVMNKPTVRVLREYLGAQKQLRANMFPQDWPGTVYKLGDEGFEVAMGVPGGKGVAYLLATHREQLGWKEVYQVQIFADRSSFFNIMYLIRDHTEEPGQELKIRQQLREPQVASKSLTVRTAGNVVPWIQRRYGTLDYKTAQKKGWKILCLVEATIDNTPQSQWTDINDLAQYGWTQSGPTQRNVGTDAHYELAQALSDPALGISTAPTDNLRYYYKHEYDSESHGKKYPATQAIYASIINARGGVIIAQASYGPDYEGQQLWPKVQGDAVVPLKQFSDLNFLQWQQAAGANIKNLRYIFRSNIQNDDTEGIIEEIMHSRKQAVTPWPGLELPMDGQDKQAKEDALALLGSPHGMGPGYLLAQHKMQLGLKIIKSVTIFSAADDDLNLCFKIIDGDTNDQGTTLAETQSEMLDAGAVEGSPGTTQQRRAQWDPTEMEIEDAAIYDKGATGLMPGHEGGIAARATAFSMKLAKCFKTAKFGCFKGLWLD